MSKLKVRIERLTPVGSRVKLELEYPDTDTRGTYIAVNSSKALTTRDAIESKRESVYFIDFPQGVGGKTLEFDLSNKGDKLVYEKLMRHPSVDCEGNPNKKTVFYRIFNVDEEKRQEVSTIKKIGLGINHVSSLDFNGMYETAFLLGLDASRLEVDDLFIRLANPINGLVHSNWDRVRQADENPTAKMEIVIKKGLISGYISNRGEGLYYKDVFIGREEKDALFYFQTNKVVYENSLVKDIQEWDSRNLVKITNQTDVAKAKTDLKELEEVHDAFTKGMTFDDLKLYANEHGIVGWQTCKEPRLREKVFQHKSDSIEKERIKEEKKRAVEEKIKANIA